MNFEAGQIVMSKAGHDKLSYYIVVSSDDKYLYLVNGKTRTMDKAKKKKIIHVQPTLNVDKDVANKIKSGTVTDEEIKRTIKLYIQKIDRK